MNSDISSQLDANVVVEVRTLRGSVTELNDRTLVGPDPALKVNEQATRKNSARYVTFPYVDQSSSLEWTI
jgi:hypothetical protein